MVLLLQKLLLYKTYSTSWLLLLLVPTTLLISTTRSQYFDYGNEENKLLNIVNDTMISIKEDLLACCNGTTAEFKQDIHSQTDMLLDKLSEVAEKSDMDDISAIINNLAAKSDEAYLTEVVSALPTQESDTYLKENPYSEEHLRGIKRTYQSFFSIIMDKMKNSSSTLQDDIDKMKEEIDSLMTFQNNVTNIMDKIDGLPTHESFQNITNEFTDIATKEDIQSTEEQIINLNNKLKDSLSADNLKLKDLLTHKDVKALIPIFSNIISQEDLEILNKDVRHLSSENSVNILFEKMDLLAKKEDLEQMGNLFVSNKLVFKNDLEKVLGQMLGVANKTVVKVLENNINVLQEEIDDYLDQLFELKDIVRTLLQDLEMQDELINTLDLHINKLSASEALLNLKELLLATYSTTNASLEYVEGQEFMISSTSLTVTNPPNDCMHKNIIEERMIDLHYDIDSVCNNYKLQDSVLSLETKLLQKIDNISLVTTNKKDCQEPSTSQINPKMEASPCINSHFKDKPKHVNVCSVIVKNYLCTADPLIGYHCCRSCVRAKQIEEEGPHRYFQATRKINYSSVRWAIEENKV